MRDGEPWAVLAGVLAPVSIDLAMESWRIPIFLVFCIFIGFPVLALWAAVTQRKE